VICLSTLIAVLVIFDIRLVLDLSVSLDFLFLASIYMFQRAIG